MWAELEKKGTESLRKEGYTFPGYMALCFFACPLLTEEEHCLKNFTTGNNKVTGIEDGRAATRRKLTHPDAAKRLCTDEPYGKTRLTTVEKYNYKLLFNRKFVIVKII